jgi:excisionase family DNA binding protein
MTKRPNTGVTDPERKSAHFRVNIAPCFLGLSQRPYVTVGALLGAFNVLWYESTMALDNVPRTFSPAQVAEHLGVHRRTVYAWMASGSLNFRKAGPRLVVITETDLLVFLGLRELTKAASPKAAPSKAPPVAPPKATVSATPVPTVQAAQADLPPDSVLQPSVTAPRPSAPPARQQRKKKPARR